MSFSNYEIVKIHWRNLKIFFSRTTEPISTKLFTKHPWVKGIQVCSNEGPHPFPRGDNYASSHIPVSVEYKIHTVPFACWLQLKYMRIKPWKFTKTHPAIKIKKNKPMQKYFETGAGARCTGPGSAFCLIHVKVGNGWRVPLVCMKLLWFWTHIYSITY